LVLALRLFIPHGIGGYCINAVESALADGQSLLNTSRLPPFARTSSLTIDNPSPRPTPLFVVVPGVNAHFSALLARTYLP